MYCHHLAFIFVHKHLKLFFTNHRPNMVDILHGWFPTLHVFHLIQKFNMASTTNSFWCWNFKILSETTRGMNMLFCRNMSYLTLLKSFVFVHRKSKMATAAGQIKKSKSSQKLDIWLNPNWTWVIAEWSLTNYLFSLKIGNPRWSWG